MVGVGRVAAAGAAKFSLGAPGFGVSDAAAVAGLGGSGGVQPDMSDTGFRGFVVEHMLDVAPALLENGFVEAGFCLYVPARVVNGASGRAHHIGYPKVFGDQEVVSLGDGVCSQGAGGAVAELVAQGVSLLVQVLELAPGLGVGGGGLALLPDQEECGPALVGNHLTVVGVQPGLVAGQAQPDCGASLAGQLPLGLLDPGVQPGLVGGGVGDAGGGRDGADDARVDPVGGFKGFHRGLPGIGWFLVSQPDGDLVRLEGDAGLAGLPVLGNGPVGFQLDVGQTLDAQIGSFGVKFWKADNWMWRGFNCDSTEAFGSFAAGLAAGRQVRFRVDVGIPGDGSSLEGGFG